MHHCFPVSLLLCALLTGCGQKGPLYLPEAEAPATDIEAPQDDPVTTEAADTADSSAR